MKIAADLKEEGNYWYKEKNYQKAISKYCKVKLYVDAVAPKSFEEGEGSGILQAAQKFKINEEIEQTAHELQATTFLNMSICHFIMKDFSKSVEKGLNSIKYKKSIKGYYRVAQAFKAQ